MTQDFFLVIEWLGALRSTMHTHAHAGTRTHLPTDTPVRVTLTDASQVSPASGWHSGSNNPINISWAPAALVEIGLEWPAVSGTETPGTQDIWTSPQEEGMRGGRSAGNWSECLACEKGEFLACVIPIATLLWGLWTLGRTWNLDWGSFLHLQFAGVLVLLCSTESPWEESFPKWVDKWQEIQRANKELTNEV